MAWLVKWTPRTHQSNPTCAGATTSSSRCCELAAVSFTFRSGTPLFVDHQGQLLMHDLRLLYGERVVIQLV